MMAKVAVIACPSYEEAQVLEAVKRGIGLLGGPRRFIRPGERILLKPNSLAGDPPERCSTTHPAVFAAVGRLFKPVGARLCYGDSPGFGRPRIQLRRAGLGREAERLEIPLADFEEGREIVDKHSPFTKRFTIANGVLDSDGIISIAKFKTHQLTRISAAIKNQFGCIPGMLKAEYHVKIPNPLDFARMLVALNLVLKPRLYVVDGIMAMEGNGPRSGDPVRMKVLLFSRDPVALEAVLCRMIDLDPEFVPTMKPGQDWGLGTYRFADIELLGDPLADFRNPGFKVTRKPVTPVVNRGFRSIFKNWISPRPVIEPQRCIRCGLCIRVCPVEPKAVDWPRDKELSPPVHDYKRCIRCFCCQEFCPEKAIHVTTPLLGRVLFNR